MRIEILNPIYSKCSNYKQIWKCLSYTNTYWIKTPSGMKRKTYQAGMINRYGFFYTGLVSRVKKYLSEQDIEFQITISDTMKKIDKEVIPSRNISLPGVSLREYQSRLVQSAIEHKRGLLVAMPGMGKTIIALSIIKAFSKYKILFLVPTLTLLRQTIDELKRFGFDSTDSIGEGNKTIKNDITVSTVQSFRSICELGHIFDVIIVDEAHTFITDTSLRKILSHVAAPIRIGLTATPSTEEYKILLCEGLLGPIIDNVTVEEGQKLEVLSKIKLDLIPVPKKETESRMYKDVYNDVIVKHDARNKIITNKVIELVKKKKTSIVFVSKIEHGEILHELFLEKGIKAEFVNGKVDSTERNKIKHLLERKEIDTAIATTVWREGLNIVSLDAVILAHGGKSEIALMQAIGRALRKTKSKNEACIIDFLDQSKYLSEHCVQRISLYKDIGWI